jgi:hypothetical protein
MTVKVSKAALAADSSFASVFNPEGNSFNLSISGTWAGTLSLQRSFDNALTWLNVKTYVDTDATEVEEIVDAFETGVLYRIGFDGVTHTSGTANVRLSY